MHLAPELDDITRALAHDATVNPGATALCARLIAGDGACLDTAAPRSLEHEVRRIRLLLLTDSV